MEEVFADVTKKVKMTHKIKNVGENIGDRLAYAGSHIVDAGGRGPVRLLYISQKRGNMIRIFRRYFVSFRQACMKNKSV